MENPPDLIVVIGSDEQNQEKKKLFIENANDEQDKEKDELIAMLRLEKYALECQVQQLRNQLAMRNNSEFVEQSRLLQKRFQDEIQSTIHQHTELVEHTTNELSAYITKVLQRSIEDIESLRSAFHCIIIDIKVFVFYSVLYRLLHQKELSAHSKLINDCIQQQSSEMSELCYHLIEQKYTIPNIIFDKLADDFQSSLYDLKTSFDSKMNYLTDIHSSTIDKLNAKHETEIEEIKCELHLMSNQ